MKKFMVILVSMMVVSGLLQSSAFSGEQQRTCTIRQIAGQASIRRFPNKEWEEAQQGMVLNQGDIIKTSPKCTVLLEVEGLEVEGQATTVEVAEKSQMMISELVKDDESDSRKTLLDLAIGKVLIRTKKLHTAESQFEVKTPTSVVGVRGTVFSVEVEAVE